MSGGQELWPAIVAGVSIGAGAGFLGAFMLGRQVALMAGPLGHLALPAAALAQRLAWEPALLVFPFVVAGGGLLWSLKRRSKLPLETLVAVVFAVGVASGLLLLPMEGARTLLAGNLESTTPWHATGASLLASMDSVLLWHSRRAILLLFLSEDLAATEGLEVDRLNLSFLLLVSVSVALGVHLVGGLLTAALVALPAATARLLSRRLGSYLLLSTALGATYPLLGLALARGLGQPAGPWIILLAAGGFLLAQIPTSRAGS